MLFMLLQLVDGRVGGESGGGGGGRRHAESITGPTGPGSRTPCSILRASPTRIRSEITHPNASLGTPHARTVLLPLPHTEQLDTHGCVDAAGRVAGQQDP